MNEEEPQDEVQDSGSDLTAAAAARVDAELETARRLSERIRSDMQEFNRLSLFSAQQQLDGGGDENTDPPDLGGMDRARFNRVVGKAKPHDHSDEGSMGDVFEAMVQERDAQSSFNQSMAALMLAHANRIRGLEQYLERRRD